MKASTSLKIAVGGGLILVVSLATTSAFACATCGFGQDASTAAFQSTTWILTAVPLVTVGGIIYWIRKKHQKLASQPLIEDAPVR